MKYLSLFSGIEAATVAWHPLGWEPVAFCEWDKHPSGLLAEKYPDIPNFGDVSRITKQQIKALGQIDMVVFGSPCQDLSVAGKRKGFNGERSSLFRDAIRVIRWARDYVGCRFALWENVPGAYSSNKGRDFAEVVKSLAGLENIKTPTNGWGSEGAALGDNGLVEWASLDAQWFGLAQRRKRVFALVDFGDWESRPPILLEPESLRWDSPPCRNAGKIAGALTKKGVGATGADDNQAQANHLIPEQLVVFDCKASATHMPKPQGVISHTLRSMSGKKLNGGGHVAVAFAQNQVRRLTPRECEKLQGFPENYTACLSDTQRYRALGNSMAVPVMRHIGEKIQAAINYQLLEEVA